MKDLLRMRLLGYPELSLGGVPLAFRRRKTVALLVYLVLTGRPASREMLAALLADETSQTRALQSLRTSVVELREHLQGHLVLSRQAVAFNSAAPHWVDAQEFQHKVAAARGAVDALASATELYAGALLAGFTLRSAPGFDAWLAAERQHLRDVAFRAWDAQLDAHIRAGDVAAGLADAERLLAVSPTAERTYRKTMTLLAAHGERERALDLYERCRAALHARLGVAPLPETTALYEQIRDRRLARARGAPAPPGGEHPSGDELATLVERLVAPECRLVTLRAPAAATALALRAVTFFLAPSRAQQPFPDGIYVTAPGAEPPGSHGQMYGLEQRIWRSLAEDVARPNPDGEMLLGWLGARTMLLVLDGLAPTDDDVALVAAILRRAPRVTLLAVARERLWLQEEWVLDVGEAR